MSFGRAIVHTVRFKATDVFDYYKPGRCARRVTWLAHGYEQELEEDPFVDLLRILGERHERGHVATFPGILDLSYLKESPDERERRTIAAIRDGVPAIYQPRFRQAVPLDSDLVDLIGEPDFLLRAEGGAGYVVRDSKLARNVLSSRHAGIPAQLQIYGYLYELAAGAPPSALEVHNGEGAIVRVEYRGAAAVLDLLREHRRLRSADPGVYEPIGLTKCGGCGYEARCGDEARAARDVSLLQPVDQKKALLLHSRGITSIDMIPAAIEGPDHRDLFWEGKKNPRVSATAARLRRFAEAFLTGKPVRIETPVLPDAARSVFLDLEGLPAYLDELEKIYLWGLKDYRGEVPRFLPAVADFGAQGDRAGWERFLAIAGRLLSEAPDLKFIHWGSYERTAIERYRNLFGGDRVADTVLANLVDLLPVMRASMVLPVPSYGLKSVEKLAGFQRKLAGYQGSLAMARYIEACETDDGASGTSVVGAGLAPAPSRRDEIMREILAYNGEDLDATRAVMEWLRNLRDEGKRVQ